MGNHAVVCFPVHVELTLLDLSASCMDDDDDDDATTTVATGANKKTAKEKQDVAVVVARLMDKVFHDHVQCCDAAHQISHQGEVGASSSCSLEEDNVKYALRRDVERFVRPLDQLLALGSILLKNQAYWQTVINYNHGTASNQHDDDKAAVLVRLPRTIHKKPYIPNKSKNNNQNDDDDKDDGSLSVSHQFPFVGAALRLSTNRSTNPENDDTPSSPPLPLVGCDIVVQEPLNTRLYRTWHDFVQVFEESFDAVEWQDIVMPCKDNNNNDDTSSSEEQSLLHEFLLRWAVKEAYTKALGVGLGFDFASFRVQFKDLSLPSGDGKNANTTGPSCQRLSDYLAATVQIQQASNADNHNKGMAYLRGQVILSNATAATTTTSLTEEWDFFFVRLALDPWSWACVAVGPVDGTRHPQLQVRWTTLEHLVPPLYKTATHVGA